MNNTKNVMNYLKISLLFCFFLSVDTYAQEIKCNVTVNLDQVAFENRNYISSLQNDLENYIDNQKFSDITWEGEKIPIDIQIVLSGGTNNIFQARMFIMSKRLLDGPSEEPAMSLALKLLENSWSFEYNMGANLSYNPMRFDKFTSVIDYYMLIVIGFDMDTYQTSGGNPAFDKARNIAVMASSNNAVGFETNTQPGVFNKYNFVNEIVDLRYSEIRRLIFAYYVNGLDVMGFDKDKGKKEIKNILFDMANYKRNKLVTHSTLLQAFFETKAHEIATIFNGEQDDEFFTELMFLDPSNTIIYTQAKEGKVQN
jgi:hypothetical protein